MHAIELIPGEINVNPGGHEWLVTNGIGGWASGTVAGILTRRYHGLLVAALQPPTGRTLLVAKAEATAIYDGRVYPLFANQWADGAVDPRGYQQLVHFYLDGGTPVWRYVMADALLEKRIWMERGANTTYVQFQLLRGSQPLELRVKVLANHRDYHGETHAGDTHMQVSPMAGGLRVDAGDAATSTHLLADRGEWTPQRAWYQDFSLAVEQARGFPGLEDHLYAGLLETRLAGGESVTLVASAAPIPQVDGAASAARRRRREERLIAQATPLWSSEEWSREDQSASAALRQLVLAADQFIVDRPSPDDPDGKTIIAGYPWFTDWGRDAMIALSGLTLVTGRPAIARQILRTFAGHVDQGMLPNRFPDVGETPEYNTVDATLWYFEAIRAYIEATDDVDLLHELFPVLADIVAWHRRGTRYHIHVDERDGLLYAGEPSVQLTWMDAKVDDWVVTPRIGKPVEVNALWCNALSSMVTFAERLGQDTDPYDNLASRARSGFERFWSAEHGYCFDVIDGPDGDDSSLRPNQIFAVSLPHSPLSAARQRAVVDVCARHLLTPHGLRSLDVDHPAYAGKYGGSPRQRDGAYHQGTVWGWLMGPFVQAYLAVYGDAAAARSFLTPLLRQLNVQGLGSIGEIFDGDPPFTPRGAFAQAWGVAEVLRAWRLTQE